MTLDEAIVKIGQIANKRRQSILPSDREAMRLSIEVLKAYTQARRLGLPLRCDTLPGEEVRE